MLVFFVNDFIPLGIINFAFFVFLGPVDEKVKPPSISVSNFRCVEKIATWCFVNRTYNNCSTCLNFKFVNTTNVTCIRCERAVVDVFINWTRPRTFTPIIRYTLAYGGKAIFSKKEFAPGEKLTIPPVSNVENI